MKSLFLIAQIAGHRVALPAEVVQSVVEIEVVTPVPLAPAHVFGLAALRSRTLTIIDPLASLGLEPRPVTDIPAEAVVVTIDGHLYGVLVDLVEDVITIAAPPRPALTRLTPGWARVASGTFDHEEMSVLVLDPGALVAGAALADA